MTDQASWLHSCGRVHSTIRAPSARTTKMWIDRSFHFPSPPSILNNSFVAIAGRAKTIPSAQSIASQSKGDLGFPLARPIPPDIPLSRPNPPTKPRPIPASQKQKKLFSIIKPPLINPYVHPPLQDSQSLTNGSSRSRSSAPPPPIQRTTSQISP